MTTPERPEKFLTIEQLNKFHKKLLAKATTPEAEAEIRVGWAQAQADFHARKLRIAEEEKRVAEAELQRDEDEWEMARRMYGEPMGSGPGLRLNYPKEATS